MKKLLLLFLLGVSYAHAMQKEEYKEILIEIGEHITEGITHFSDAVCSEATRWMLGEEYEALQGCICCNESCKGIPLVYRGCPCWVACPVCPPRHRHKIS